MLCRFFLVLFLVAISPALATLSWACGAYFDEQGRSGLDLNQSALVDALKPAPKALDAWNQLKALSQYSTWKRKFLQVITEGGDPKKLFQPTFRVISRTDPAQNLDELMMFFETAKGGTEYIEWIRRLAPTDPTPVPWVPGALSVLRENAPFELRYSMGFLMLNQTLWNDLNPSELAWFFTLTLSDWCDVQATTPAKPLAFFQFKSLPEYAEAKKFFFERDSDAPLFGGWGNRQSYPGQGNARFELEPFHDREGQQEGVTIKLFSQLNQLKTARFVRNTRHVAYERNQWRLLPESTLFETYEVREQVGTSTVYPPYGPNKAIGILMQYQSIWDSLTLEEFMRFLQLVMEDWHTPPGY